MVQIHTGSHDPPGLQLKTRWGWSVGGEVIAARDRYRKNSLENPSRYPLGRPDQFRTGGALGLDNEISLHACTCSRCAMSYLLALL